MGDFSFDGMKKDIIAAGGLFYQYRPCRRDASTIYDIENIRHGVVYAQTPLNMNDPFDSMIGFSTERVYEECIEIIVNDLETDESIKTLIKYLLKYKLVGKIAELINSLNSLKKFLIKERHILHGEKIPFDTFLTRNQKHLYKNMPRTLKQHFDTASMLVWGLIVANFGNVEIDETQLMSALQLDDGLTELHDQIVKISDGYFLKLKEILSKTTISCFSVSGWNNQLMWSHYANSYAGICVEYDLSELRDNIGFVYPVNYLAKRPTVSLKDFGITTFQVDENGVLKTDDANPEVIISHLLAKNQCWKYEEEWRIINFGRVPFAPKFITMPRIKSITFGPKIDLFCKKLLWDISRENKIDCYDLRLKPDSYTVERVLLDEAQFPFDMDEEAQYISSLMDMIVALSEKIEENAKRYIESCKNGNIQYSYMLQVLQQALDLMSNAYFLKATINRMCEHAPDETLEESQRAEILKVDSIILEAEKQVPLIRDETQKSFEVGLIQFTDFIPTQVHLNNIQELVEKYKTLPWNSTITGEK